MEKVWFFVSFRDWLCFWFQGKEPEGEAEDKRLDLVSRSESLMRWQGVRARDKNRELVME